MAKKRVPVARYQNMRFEVINVYGLRLDLSELMMALVLMIFAPLFLLGAGLTLPQLLISVICVESWPILLFGLRREGYNVAEWLGVLLPYWTRQKTFSRRPTRVTQNPRTELLDRSISAGPNLVSWEFNAGADGVPEVHVYEDPTLPYRALISRWRIAAENRSLEQKAGHPLNTPHRPPVVELP
jgi:hypothetical protein